MNEFTFIDLFAGIGGFRLSCERHGGRSVGFSEINNNAINAYCRHFNEEVSNNLGDITKVEKLPAHDLMTAGVPCQSWSTAGKKLGFEDKRGRLWFDTLRLLGQSRPKAFIFENVRGLTEDRNKEALQLILDTIRDNGYQASYKVIDAYDMGSLQHRERLYIVGFRDEEYFKRFSFADVRNDNLTHRTLGEILDTPVRVKDNVDYPDVFMFADPRQGRYGIHSWDLADVSETQRTICETMLKNCRKSIYGPNDINPLSMLTLKHFVPEMTDTDMTALMDLNILRKIPYSFIVNRDYADVISDIEQHIVNLAGMFNEITYPEIKRDKQVILSKRKPSAVISDMLEKGILTCDEYKYGFKNNKISSGINGVYRIMSPSVKTYPTLVASDSNDYVATKLIDCSGDVKSKFIDQIYRPHNYRKLSVTECLRIQGFPDDYKLPEQRSAWMHLIGNSVDINVIDLIVKTIVNTGVFK